MSKPLTISISHDLGREQATRQVRSGFDRVGNALGFGVKLDQSWENDTMRFNASAIGQEISGNLRVFEETVEMELYLPAFLAGVAHKIAGKVKKEGTLLLEKK